MAIFRYFPPGPDEQKNFALQFLGTLLCLTLAAVFYFFTKDIALKAVLIGAVLGVLWLLARAAWQLENKASRAQNTQIEIDEEGILITGAPQNSQKVLWTEITDLEVRGGRLMIEWPGGELALGAREVENGMEMVREITRRHSQHASGDNKPATPSNFIPLEPR